MTSIMGILNVTPDSFYDGGYFANIEKAVKQFNELKQYADIIDIGAESTRPGAEPITAEVEIKRLEPLLNEILPQESVKISIDTYHAKTAEFVLNKGVNIINAVKWDKEIVKIVVKHNAALVIMARDTLGNIENTIVCLDNLIKQSKDAGLSEKNMILDIGIGFLGGSDADLLALRKFGEIKDYYANYKIMVGASRKSFIGKVLNIEAKDRLIGTIAVNLYVKRLGADILRVHDAKETKEAINMIDAMESM